MTFDPRHVRPWPGGAISCLGHRSPELLAKGIALVDPEGNPLLQPQDLDGRPGDETTCNLAAGWIAETQGVSLPHVFYDRREGRWGFWENSARGLGAWLAAHGAAYGWRRVSDHEALVLAMAGYLVTAVGGGHVGTLRPEQRLDAPRVEWRIAQAGALCSNNCSMARGFGSKLAAEVMLYGHD